MKEQNTEAAEQLFRDYITYYEERWLQGKLSPCNEEATKEIAKYILLPASCLCEEFGGETLYSIIATYLQNHNDQEGDSLKNVIRAFEFLELVSVNLFLSPWRKEIKSLKTFTGSFVYNVRSVLPETVVKGILQKLGYSTLTATEFILTEKIDEQKSQKTAFAIFLARIECELIMELSNGGKMCNLLKFLRTRAAVPGKNEVEKQENETAFKNDPQSLVNANIKKTNTRPISKQSSLIKDGLPPGARGSKVGGHFEADKVSTTSTTEMYPSETTVGLVVDSKEAFNTKQSADCSGRGIGFHISDSDERRRNNKLTHCSDLQCHMNNSQGLSSSTSTENIKIGSKQLKSPKTAEKTIMDSNGPNTTKPTNKMGSKEMSPSKSTENKRTDNKGLSTSRSNENTELDSKVQHTSKSDESIEIGIEGHSGFKSNEDRNMDFAIKDLSESVDVTKTNSKVMSDLESVQDTRERTGTDQSDSAADMRNKEVTHIFNSASKNFGVGSTGQITDNSSASKSLATECFHSTRSESEEFLNQYSDINIGRKPLFQDNCFQKYNKLKENKSVPGLGATVLEEASTSEPNLLTFCENGCQTFAFCTDAKVDATTDEPKAVSEKCNVKDGSTFTTGSTLFKPLNAETDVKKENTLSPTIIHVAQPKVSNKDDCDLALLISRLNINEHVEGNLQYPVEESTSNESESFKNSPQRNSKKAEQAMINCSNSIFDYPGPSNVAKCDHICKMAVHPTEVHCGSTKILGIDRAATGKSSENHGEVREPPRLTYIPPDGFENQPFNDSYESAHFSPYTKSEQDPSTMTMPDGDYILQMREDTKEDFVVISHQSASID